MQEIIVHGKPVKVSQYKKIDEYIMYFPEIGHGTISKVYPAALQKELKINLAIKAIPKDLVQKYKIFIERMIKIEEILQKENFCLNLIRKDQSANFIYLFYPLIPDGTLQAYLNKHSTLSEKEAKVFIYNILKLVLRMHQKGIIHRDINPNHLYFNPTKDEDMVFLIGGFLLSTIQMPNEQISEYVGTEGYIAPEVMMCIDKQVPYSFPADVWSVGAISYTLLFGKYPALDDYEETIKNSPFSQNCKDLLFGLLERDPNKRGTIEKIINNHPFFHQNQSLSESNQIVLKDLEADSLVIPTKENTYPYIINNEKKLGEGSFGSVYECSMDVNGKPDGIYAMKRTNLSTITHKAVKEQLKQEIKFLILLKNEPYTIHLYDYFIMENDLYMVIEYCNGGTLTKYIEIMHSKNKFLDYEELNLISWDVALAMQKMHEKGIVHRDIKADNILLVKNSFGVITDAKVCDFGLSKKSKACKTILGTPIYWAPELYTISKGSKTTYTNKIDVWSYGILLYFLAYGIELLEYPGNKLERLYKGDYDLPKNNSKLCAEFIDLMNSCLKIKPETRPSFEEILRHTFFQKIKCVLKEIMPLKLIQPPIIEKQTFYLYNEEDKKFIVKRYKSSYSNKEEGIRHIKNEIEILSRLKGSPNIVRINQFFLFKNEFYIELQNCNGGNLMDYLKNRNLTSFPEEDIKMIVRSLIQALKYIHERDIYHRDIRPEHVLLITDKDKILAALLGGFGTSRFLNKKGENVSYYISNFASPEMCSGGIYREDTDIYSLGVLVYFMAYGLTPREFFLTTNSSNETLPMMKITYPKSFPTNPKMSAEFYKLIERCMADQHNRIKANELKNDPFLK